MRLLTMIRQAAFLGILVFLSPWDAMGQTAGWQKEWNQLIAAAQKEGKVVIVGPPDAPLRRELPVLFREKFGITLEYIGARGADNEARLSMERRAGLYTADAVMAGLSNMIDYYDKKMIDPLLSNLILPEVLDPSKWKGGKLWFLDPEEKYILRLYNYITAGKPAINTRHVPAGELKLAKDLLNPKWRGKISVYDPTVSGTGQNEAASYYRVFGKEFITKLYIDQKPAVSRDKRQLMDWLAHGVYPINLGGVETDSLMELREQGIPLQLNILADFPGTLSAGAGIVAIMNRPPHTNAARLFVNWITSKEGVGLLGRLRRKPTTRSDIDESYALPWETPQPGVKYFDTYTWEFNNVVLPDVQRLMVDLLRK